MFFCRTASRIVPWLLMAGVEAVLAQGSETGAENGAKNREDARVWIVGLAAQTDEDSSSSIMTSFNLELAEQTWFFAAAGRSSTPENRSDVQADTLELGIEHEFGPVGLSFRAENWGDTGNLTSKDWAGSLFFGNERYRVALEHLHRDIDIDFAVTGPLGDTIYRRAGVDADGAGVALRFSPAPRWQLFASWTKYEYSRRLSLLPRVADLDLLSASTITLANSFSAEYASLGLERSFGSRLLTIDMNRDRSEIDGARFETINAAFLFPVSYRIDIEFNLGRSDSERYDSGLYGGLMLMIYGGG
jgi:hypothetical protein